MEGIRDCTIRLPTVSRCTSCLQGVTFLIQTITYHLKRDFGRNGRWKTIFRMETSTAPRGSTLTAGSIEGNMYLSGGGSVWRFSQSYHYWLSPKEEHTIRFIVYRLPYFGKCFWDAPSFAGNRLWDFPRLRSSPSNILLPGISPRVSPLQLTAVPMFQPSKMNPDPRPNDFCLISMKLFKPREKNKSCGQWFFTSWQGVATISDWFVKGLFTLKRRGQAASLFTRTPPWKPVYYTTNRPFGPPYKVAY